MPSPKSEGHKGKRERDQAQSNWHSLGLQQASPAVQLPGQSSHLPSLLKVDQPTLENKEMTVRMEQAEEYCSLPRLSLLLPLQCE